MSHGEGGRPTASHLVRVRVRVRVMAYIMRSRKGVLAFSKAWMACS